MDADFCRRARAGAQRSERRRRRLRRGDRRAQHRLVGGLGDAGVVRQPLRGARRRRAPGLLVGLGRCAAVRTGGRGGHARRVPARAVARGRSATSASTRTLSEFHGYDLDFCLQVREAGRKVITADFRAIHHRPLEMLPDAEPWVEAHMRVAEKWDGRIPGIGTAPAAGRSGPGGPRPSATPPGRWPTPKSSSCRHVGSRSSARWRRRGAASPGA